MEKEPLLLYIAATNQVVSAVLVAERDAWTKKTNSTVNSAKMQTGF